jgi:3-deoxy-D-manno-octulosonic acid (KDO) 8-phosphate synthase
MQRLRERILSLHGMPGESSPCPAASHGSSTAGAAAVAVGIDGLFVEVHNAPERALSDGANALRLDLLPELWRRLCALDGLVKSLDSTERPSPAAAQNLV